MKVLSIHWGFSIGGVGKYSTLIDRVDSFADINIKSICIVNRKRQVDLSNLALLRDKKILWRRHVLDFGWLSEIKKTIDDWQPDFIMSHGFNGHFITFVSKLILRKKIPAVCSYHGEYHATTPARKFLGVLYNRFTEYYIRKRATSTVAVAGFCVDYLIKKGVSPDKISLIHNGIGEISFKPAVRNKLRKEWNVVENEILIGVASRLDPVKGIDFLIKAFSNIAPKYLHTKLVVIGTGSIEQVFKKTIRDLDLNHRVIFTGFRDDVPDCLMSFDIFALPSLAEYHSIGLLEAMRAGLAILATDVGGNTESVRDGHEGLIVPSADAKALTLALKRLIEDDALRANLGEAAKKRYLADFTEERMVQRTATWFQGLLVN